MKAVNLISLSLALCLLLCTGRASLHGKASLQIDPVRSEDQGWYECRVLMLEQQYDTFHNGSWVHLTVNGESSVQTVLTGNMCLWVWMKEENRTCVTHLSFICNNPVFVRGHFRPYKVEITKQISSDLVQIESLLWVYSAIFFSLFLLHVRTCTFINVSIFWVK